MRVGTVSLIVLALIKAAGVAGPTVATVYVFTTVDCPIANRYAPEIKRLAARFEPHEVRFRLVYPVPSDSDEIVRNHVRKFEYRLPYTRDIELELVKRTGVTVTPEVAVENARGEIVYRGRVDDRYVDFGKERRVPTTHDLERALEAVVTGRSVAVRETRAVGCFLVDLLK